jgi:hypothetical protein
VAATDRPLDAGGLSEMISRHRAGIAYCVRCAAALGPVPHGEVVVRAVFDRSGRTSATAVVRSDGDAPRLGLCLASYVYRWRFPPADQNVTTVDITLSTSDSSGDEPCAYDSSYPR